MRHCNSCGCDIIAGENHHEEWCPHYQPPKEWAIETPKYRDHGEEIDAALKDHHLGTGGENEKLR